MKRYLVLELDCSSPQSLDDECNNKCYISKHANGTLNDSRIDEALLISHDPSSVLKEADCYICKSTVYFTIPR